MMHRLKRGDLMYEAASRNDCAMLEEAFEDPLYIPNEKDLDDCLMRAAKVGSEDIIRRLLEVQAKTEWYKDTENAHSETPLMIATIHSHKDIIAVLLAAGVDVDVRNDRGRTALHLAVSNRDYLVTKMLLRADANTEVADMYGDTPLLLCARKGFPDMVRVLLRGGAHLQATSTMKDTCLHYAAQFANHSVIKMLRDRGADINAVNVWQYTPLLIAVQNNQSGAAKILIDNDCDIHARDRSGRTALFHCVKRDMMEVMQQLLLRGASPDTVDDAGNTPMHEAVCHNDIHVIKLFIQFNANVNITGKAIIQGKYRQCSPLEVALAQNCNMAVALLLVSAGCDTTKVRSILRSGEIAPEIMCDAHFYMWIEDMSRGPFKLANLTRMVIRGAMTGYVLNGIDKLPVPQMVKNYLSFHDVFETMEFFHYN